MAIGGRICCCGGGAYALYDGDELINRGTSVGWYAMDDDASCGVQCQLLEAAVFA